MRAARQQRVSGQSPDPLRQSLTPVMASAGLLSLMHTIPDIKPFRDKLEELDRIMADPSFYSDQRKAAEVSREHQHVSHLIEKFESLRRAEQAIAENKLLLQDEALEAELREMAEEELAELNEQQATLQMEVLRAMIPPETT
jgi:peptide chain release factor 1